MVNHLAYKELGYHIISEFYSQEKSSMIIEEINRLHTKYKDRLWKDSVDSDNRLFGANKESDLISKFYTDTFINKLTSYFEMTPKFHGFTMAANMIYKAPNPGSGGGWHRDRADQRQLKVLLYLTDVDEKNGPFQYFEGSHSPTSILQSVLLQGFQYNQNRYKDEEIERLDQTYMRTAIGKAGTLLLADVRGIHRGMPMLKGKRTILMNYTWPHSIPRHIKKLMI
ncbi:MAG: phytanoyl-CoA dioxygenase family protein [Flavobacteriales bacterium]|nr:phytanoyl-CoA dioxygenase family protein [Flavobacteriales bacterium]